MGGGEEFVGVEKVRSSFHSLARATVMATMFALHAPMANSATITVLDHDTIHIEGVIERGDFERFREAFASTSGPVSVSLNSPGGSLSEALSIAKLIRDAWMVTEISEGQFVHQTWQTLPKPVRCDSVCALIFVAGAARIYGVHDDKNGRPALGFHRVHLAPEINAQLDATSAEREFGRGNDVFLTALADYDAPQAFVEKIVRTRSDDLILLDASEFYTVFGQSRQLGDGIPWLEEFLTARCGRRLTDAEYEWMDKHRNDAEGKRLNDRIYERLRCVNQLKQEHQDSIRKRLRGIP